MALSTLTLMSSELRGAYTMANPAIYEKLEKAINSKVDSVVRYPRGGWTRSCDPTCVGKFIWRITIPNCVLGRLYLVSHQT